jgi:hypothetical protein
MRLSQKLSSFVFCKMNEVKWRQEKNASVWTWAFCVFTWSPNLLWHLSWGTMRFCQPRRWKETASSGGSHGAWRRRGYARHRQSRGPEMASVAGRHLLQPGPGNSHRTLWQTSEQVCGLRGKTED